MMAADYRRSSTDEEWQKVKKLVDQRDKRSCQFIKCLSAKEAHQLQNGSPTTLDRAHIFSAANFPDLVYNPKNVITLKRFIHMRMDNYQSPINGDPIELNEHWYWWYRIFNKTICEYKPELDYEVLLKSGII